MGDKHVGDERMGDKHTGDEHIFVLAELAATLPAVSDTMLRDLRLVDREAASCRIFRTYRPVPLHFHVSCDEYLYVLQGRAMLQLGDAAPREVGPGMLIHFPKRTVHGMPTLLEEPFVVLAIDTPRRPPDDVTFVDAAQGDAASFIATEPVGSRESPSRALVPYTLPETFELVRRRRELAALRQELVSQEQRLGELRAQLVSFEGRYLRQVGLLYRRLDEWERKIDELHGREPKPVEDGDEDIFDEPRHAIDPAALKELFRDLAKLLHPDFAINDEDAVRRTRLMALANDAYAREDAAAIRRMLIGYDPDLSHSRARLVGEEVVRLTALAFQVQQDIEVVKLQTEELQRSGSAKLQQQAIEAAREGRDLLAEMAARVNGSIGVAMRRYELDLSKKQRPSKGLSVEEVLSAETIPQRKEWRW